MSKVNRELVMKTREYALKLYKYQGDIVNSIEHAILQSQLSQNLSDTEVEELRTKVLDTLDPRKYDD